MSPLAAPLVELTKIEADPRASARGPLPPGSSNENPPQVGLAALLAEDFHNHGSSLSSAGFWALAVHRFGNWRMSVRPFCCALL